MLGTKVTCPNKVPAFAGYLASPDYREIGTRTCGWQGYEVIQRGVFTPQSGFDPLAIKVRCRSCKHEFYVFPAVKYEAKA